MKVEERWRDIMKDCSWPHFGVVNRNNDWMSTVDDKGLGHVAEEDLVKLMENNGFEVIV